jgi:hypothetical protein
MGVRFVQTLGVRAEAEGIEEVHGGGVALMIHLERAMEGKDGLHAVLRGGKHQKGRSIEAHD